MLPKFGPLELIIILVIVTMLFGVGKLPELFGAVGRGVREFRKNSEVGDDTATPSDDKPATASTDATTTPTAPTV